MLYSEVIDMASYVDPSIREKFESLSINLKNAILEKDVQLHTIHDLIGVLEEIVAEQESTAKR
jgi:5-methylthioribose kinase